MGEECAPMQEMKTAYPEQAKRPSLVEKLKCEEAMLSERLDLVRQMSARLEAQPDLAETLNLLSRLEMRY